MCGYLIALALLVKQTVFNEDTFVKKQFDPEYMDIFLDFQFYFLDLHVYPYASTIIS